MKKYLYLLPLLIALIAGLIVWRIQARPQIGQQRTEDKGLTMLPSTIPVDQKLQHRALELLAEQAPGRGIFTYAVTNLDQKDHYFYISVAGLPDTATEMKLADALWLGVVVINDAAGYPGYVDEATQPDTAQNFDKGGSQPILPFRSGTTATYGGLGVHDCGFSLNGWKAVDLFPSEDMVYSSKAGDVSYVCRDNTQVALRIGENLYTHIVDSGQQIGDHYNQGQGLGGMVPGTYNATCGYADQQANNYHVHFCFVPGGGSSWSADGYTLSTINQNWVKGGETVAPLGTLTAEWADAGVAEPGPTAGGNFWDGIAGGVIQLIGLSVPNFPEHEAMGIADRVMNAAGPVMALVHVIAFRLFDMTIPIWVFGIILAMEAVRIVYSIYMWVKRAIPVIG